MWKILLMSTPVGALGSGLGGGVELTLYNLAQAMRQRGHQITIVAPSGSHLSSLNIVGIDGNLQISAQTQSKNEPITLPPYSVLANMWDYGYKIQDQFDLILNFAYDWLPFYLTPFFQTPVLHLVSMGSVSTAMDQVIQSVFRQFPAQIAFHTYAQAATFGITTEVRCLKNALDLSLYRFCDRPDNYLTWIGRISPEKALEDAVQASQLTNIPLKVFGKIQNLEYWQHIQAHFPTAPVEYGGFLPTDALQSHLRRSRALLMTPRWVEAFGNVVIEALACGVPVIAYRRGGPTEIIKDGKTGYLVESDRIEELVKAINKLPEIERIDCRKQAETEYSFSAMGDRLEAWFSTIVS